MQHGPRSSLCSSSKRLANATKAGERLLPLGYDLDVKYYYPEHELPESTILAEPFRWSFVLRRQVVHNATTGLTSFGMNGDYGLITEAANHCYHGNCKWRVYLVRREW